LTIYQPSAGSIRLSDFLSLGIIKNHSLIEEAKRCQREKEEENCPGRARRQTTAGNLLRDNGFRRVDGL